MYTPYYDAERWALVFTDGAAGQPDPFAAGTRVFVCGGLQHPDKMTSIIGRAAPFAPAVARGFQRVWKDVEGSPVSFMVPNSEDPQSVLTGVVWLGLDDGEVRKVEGFELAGNLRRRISVAVVVGDDTVQAITYVERS